MPFALASLLAVSGCSTYEGHEATELSYQLDDFHSFRWVWHGTGANESLTLDRDCGVAAAKYMQPSCTGVVAQQQCEQFERRVLSPDLLQALQNYSGCEMPSTDDYGTMTVQVTSGAVYKASITGCSGKPPFADVRGDMQFYLLPYCMPADAAVDSTLDAADVSTDGASDSAIDTTLGG